MNSPDSSDESFQLNSSGHRQMNSGRRPLSNMKAFEGRGLDALERLAAYGEAPRPAYGIVQCLDDLLLKYPDISEMTTPEVLLRWIGELRAMNEQQVKDAVQDEQRSNTNPVVNVLRRVIVPLLDSRRRKEVSVITALHRLFEQPTCEVKEHGIDHPANPGLYAAVKAVNKALQEGRVPRRADVRKGLIEAKLSDASTNRYTKMIREQGGVSFDRKSGQRPKRK
jgi:hypothetical protein